MLILLFTQERIHNTEKNLDMTANHNTMAEEKAKELKRLNGSMFAVCQTRIIGEASGSSLT